MKLDQLRYSLTQHIEKYFFTEANLVLLIHPAINQADLLNKLSDDLDLMPNLPNTKDNTTIKFYQYDYDETIFSKSELLAFIFAVIDEEWDIVKGIDIRTGKLHFWLKNNDVIYDPSLVVITNQNLYSKTFKPLQEIPNENIRSYLKENDNLLKFYKTIKFRDYLKLRKTDFSINFIEKISRQFNENIQKQFTLDKKSIEEIKNHCVYDDFIRLKQVLLQKRKYYVQSNKIAIHPSIDASILGEIEKYSQLIYDAMLQEYNMIFDYHNDTLGECYGLSIMFNLFDETFNLVQGGIPYKKGRFNYFYQHSWLEKENIIYDPALRLVTLKELYYIFVQKQDVYTTEETENILRRIGFNLTHFRDFMNGVQIGNNETIRYKSLVNKIDSPEMREEGEKLILVAKSRKTSIQ